MNKLYLLISFLFLISVVSATSNTINNSTSVTIYGLPPGSTFNYRYQSDGYITHSYTITGWTTILPIPSFSGNTEGFQPQNSGTAVIYNGVTYQQLETGLGACNTQFINVNGSGNYCDFYVYLNESLWNSNESAELKAANASLNSAKIIVNNIQNTTANVVYNGSLKAGAVAHVASYTNTSTGADISFITENVIKAATPQNFQLYVDGARITSAGNFTINPPVLFNRKYWNLNVSLTANLLGGNTGNYAYSINLTNGTILNPLTTVSGDSISKSLNYKINSQTGAKIRFDFSGDANYLAVDPTVTATPAFIGNYIPITLTNYQPSAVAANTPIAIGANFIGGNALILANTKVIGFNAIAYQSYEACNLQNVEFFFANGTVISSWLEGNALNEQAANALCTSSSSPNALSASANVLWWVDYQWPSSFLAANTGTATTNTIYMGFALPGVNLLNGQTVGEAPQLSCGNPMNTINCNYGEYDNGAYVFNSLYANFAGTATPPGWSEVGAVTDNGVYVPWTSGTFDYMTTNAGYGGTYLQTLDSLASVSLASGSSGNPGNFGVGFGSPSVDNTIGFFSDSPSCSQPMTFANDMIYSGNPSTCYGTGKIGTSLGAANYLYSSSWQYFASNQIAGLFSYDYDTIDTIPISSPFSISYTPSLLAGAVSWQTNGGDVYMQWMRIRNTPPANIMPATTLGTIVNQPVCPSYTAPAGATAYVCIPLTNVQTTQLNANTPVMFTVNALNYSAYTASDMQNVNFEWAGGTTANTFLEGNLLNENQYTNLDTVNALGYWVNVPSNVAAGNTIYLFMNFYSTSTNEFNTYNTGIAPQIFCATGCAATHYAQYDDGNQVFLNGYWNFEGTSLPTGWTGSGYTVANGLTLTSSLTAAYAITSAATYGDSTNTLDWLGYQQGGSTDNLMTGYLTAAGTTAGNNAVGIGSIATQYTGNYLYGSQTTALAFSVADSKFPFSTANTLFSIEWNSANSVNFSRGYGSYIDITSNVPAGQNSIGAYTGAVSGATDFIQYMRYRQDPPNDQMPEYSFNSLVAITSALSTPVLSSCPSSAKLDVGQSVSCTASISGGVSPYTYNWLISNSITNAIVANMLFTGLSSTSNTFTYKTVSADTTNSPEQFNVIVTDSHPTTVNSVYSSTFTINPDLNTPSISPSSAETFDYGQTITFSSSWSGGTSTYTANWIVVNSITGTQLANALYTGISTTSNAFGWAFPSADAGNTIQANVLITDSATTPTSSNSVKSSTITLNPALAGGTISPLSTTIDNGQSVTLRINPAGGTTPYSYQWYSNTIGNPECNSANAISGATSSAYTASPTATSNYAVKVADSATTPVSSCASGAAITVNPAFTETANSISNTIADAEQWETLTSTISGGTPSYTYNFMVTNSANGNIIANAIYATSSTSNTFTFQIPNNQNALGTEDVSFNIMDSATTNEILLSTNTITVNALLQAGSTTPSNPSIGSGGSITLTANPSGGTLPYNYQWYSNTLGNPSCTSANAIGGATASTYIATPPSNTFYGYKVTDSATTPVSGCGSPANVIIVPSLAPPTLSVSPNGLVQIGNTITITAHANPSTDAVQISINGNPVGSPQTGTVTNTLAVQNIGYNSYAISAEDTTSLSATANVYISGYVPLRIQNATTTVNVIPSNLIATQYTLHTNPSNAINVTWNVLLTGTITLTNTLLAHDIIISAGSTVTTNGYSLIATNAIINDGNILAGTIPNNGAGATTANTPGFNGISYLSSYGGSGGGGGCGFSSPNNFNGGNGGNTIAPAGLGGINNGGCAATAGSLPAPPSLTNKFISATAFNPTIFLAGAGGGGGGSGGGDGGSGGGGSYGILLQANSIYAGTINANGLPGAPAPTSGGGGGGGGGGIIIIAYNSFYTAGTYNVLGGGGGISSTGGSGGANGGNGNVMTYQWSVAPIMGLDGNVMGQRYPINITTASPSNTITYTLYENGNAVQTNVANVIYIPPPSYWTSIYGYQLLEKQYANTISVNMTLAPLNMSVLASQPSVASPDNTIQYFPLPFNALAFHTGSRPSYYLINGYKNETSPFNGVVDTLGCATLTCQINIQLVYNGLASFNTLYQENQTVNTINVNAFTYNFIATNQINANQRIVANFVVYDQETFNSLTANVTWAVNTSINGHSFTAVVSNNLCKNCTLQIPESDFVNPNITLQLNGTVFLANFFSPHQYYCPETAAYGNAIDYQLGLVDTNGTNMDFYIYTLGGQTASNYVLQINELKAVTSVGAESMLIPPSVPMAVPLESTARSYQYNIYSPGCGKKVYAGSFVGPTNPTTITITGGNSSAVIYNKTAVTGACKLNVSVSPYLLACSADDRTNLTFQYTLQVYNETTVLGSTQLLFAKTFNGPSFSYNDTLPVNKSYIYSIYAYIYKSTDPPILVNGGPLNVVRSSLAPPLLGLMAFIIMLTLIFVGVKSGKALILYLLIDVGLFVISILNFMVVQTSVIAIFSVIGLIISVWSIRNR